MRRRRRRQLYPAETHSIAWNDIKNHSLTEQIFIGYFSWWVLKAYKVYNAENTSDNAKPCDIWYPISYGRFRKDAPHRIVISVIRYFVLYEMLVVFFFTFRLGSSALSSVCCYFAFNLGAEYDTCNPDIVINSAQLEWAHIQNMVVLWEDGSHAAAVTMSKDEHWGPDFEFTWRWLLVFNGDADADVILDSHEQWLYYSNVILIYILCNARINVSAHISVVIFCGVFIRRPPLHATERLIAYTTLILGEIEGKKLFIFGLLNKSGSISLNNF